MLWGNIIKAIPFILQVILVVVAVALFAFFDPFGIFIQSRTKLKDTPVDIRSIKEIGELITAEYYGEVIGSYAHEIEEKQDTARQIYHERMLELLNYYIQEINELRDLFEEGELKRKEIFSAYQKAFEGIDNDPDYENLLLYISDRKSFKIKHLDDRIKLRKKKDLVRTSVRKGLEESMNNQDLYLKKLFDLHEETFQKDRKKKLKKKNLVMLGRGWVKAGFDFGSFNERNFNYDKTSNNIYFIGFNPKILSSTINPWFIPEEGVEGFEFLVVERKARRDYRVVQLVKQRCLDELNRKAQEREILQRAIENGRESMKEFFSLIMDEEINQVVFYDNELDYTYDEIMKNDTITGEELLLIDHLLQKKSLEGVLPENIKMAKSVFIDSLNKSKAKMIAFDSQEDNHHFPVVTLAYAVVKDGSYHEFYDSEFIDTFSRKYCQLADSIKTLKFSCFDEGLLSELIEENTNIFITGDSLTKSSILAKYKAEDIDTLASQNSQSIQIMVGKSDPEAFSSLIENQIKAACNLCSAQ